MPKKCFVIMPFGNDDAERKRVFDGVYRGIIVPAVREAGYEPIREDISATPGSIPRSIITKLAEEEMVIADLTGMNPNVFYELGIRHVLSKSGTVLIISEGEKIPFDNAGHRVIQYTNELADLDDIHNQIVTAIKKREDNPDNSDNVVHDTYPNLPINTISSFFEAIRDEMLEQMQRQVSELSRENNNLRQICIDEGISPDSQTVREKRTVKELMQNARFALQKSGRSVILKLRQLAANDDMDGFVDCLEDALDAGYMSEDDYITVNSLCDALGYLPLQVATMERAFDLFPDSDSVIRNLSDVYTRMPLKDTRMKGIDIIEKLLAVQEVDGQYVITELSSYITENNLGALFNAYIRLDLYARTISVCESYDRLGLPSMSIVIRNKASAYNELKNYDQAKIAYMELLDTDYYNDSNHAFYASLLTDLGDYINAYKEWELAAILDLNDANRYISLAIFMLNNNYARTAQDDITRIRQSNEIFDYVMPIFIQAVEIDGSNDKRTKIADILFSKNKKDYAQAILNNDSIDAINFKRFPLEYILNSDIDKIRGDG